MYSLLHTRRGNRPFSYDCRKICKCAYYLFQTEHTMKSWPFLLGVKKAEASDSRKLISHTGWLENSGPLIQPNFRDAITGD